MILRLIGAFALLASVGAATVAQAQGAAFTPKYARIGLGYEFVGGSTVLGRKLTYPDGTNAPISPSVPAACFTAPGITSVDWLGALPNADKITAGLLAVRSVQPKVTIKCGQAEFKAVMFPEVTADQIRWYYPSAITDGMLNHYFSVFLRYRFSALSNADDVKRTGEGHYVVRSKRGNVEMFLRSQKVYAVITVKDDPNDQVEFIRQVRAAGGSADPLPPRSGSTYATAVEVGVLSGQVFDVFAASAASALKLQVQQLDIQMARLEKKLRQKYSK